MRLTEEQYRALMERRGISPLSLGSQQTIASPAPPQKARQAKYLNVKTRDAQGVVHDGKGECERWQELQLMERAGAIRKLRRQVVYAFVDNGQLITTFKADFVYEDGAATIVEDHKSPRTRKLASYRHKVKLMQSHYGIQIREVTK